MSLYNRSQAGFFSNTAKILIIIQLCVSTQDNRITRKLIF